MGSKSGKVSLWLILMVVGGVAIAGLLLYNMKATPKIDENTVLGKVIDPNLDNNIIVSGNQVILPAAVKGNRWNGNATVDELEHQSTSVDKPCREYIDAYKYFEGKLPVEIQDNCHREITREEFCIFADGVLRSEFGIELSIPDKSSFEDTVNPAVMAMYQENIVDGIDRRLFAPEEPMQRQLAAKAVIGMVQRVCEEAGVEQTDFLQPPADIEKYDDYKLVDEKNDVQVRTALSNKFILPIEYVKTKEVPKATPTPAPTPVPAPTPEIKIEIATVLDSTEDMALGDTLSLIRPEAGITVEETVYMMYRMTQVQG